MFCIIDLCFWILYGSQVETSRSCTHSHSKNGLTHASNPSPEGKIKFCPFEMFPIPSMHVQQIGLCLIGVKYDSNTLTFFIGGDKNFEGNSKIVFGYRQAISL